MSDGPSAWFWELLESSHHNLRLLCRRLEALSREELIAFQDEYDEAKSDVNPLHGEAYQPYLDECSEDAADDFASWVVGQGAKVYGAVREHPELIEQFWEEFEASGYGQEENHLGWNIEVDRDEYRGAQFPSVIAYPIFRLQFGEELDAHYGPKW
jgi:hypothetical protein